MGTTTTLDDYTSRILRVLEHVQGHLDEAMSPATLAPIACFSSFHFQRVFRSLVGESVMGHIRRIRLERAAWQLKFSDRPVSEIAFDAGYEAHEAFTRAFGAHFGDSPTSFRDKHQRLEFPPTLSAVHYDAAGRTPAFEALSLDTSGLEVEIVERPTRTAAYIRHQGPYSDVGETWQELMGWVASEGLLAPGVEMLGLCFSDPGITPAEQLRYEACVTLDINFEPHGKVGRKEIPGGEFARVRHTGPYTELGQVYDRLIGHWLPTSGREAGEPPCLEEYFNSPEDTPPEELETDVYLRLRS